MGLFDSLRSKLKGVSKKLEAEVEKSLEDQLDAEVAAAVQKEQAKTAPTPPTTPAASPAPPTPLSAPAPVTPAAPTPTAAPVSKPVPASPPPAASETTSKAGPTAPAPSETQAPAVPSAPAPVAEPVPRPERPVPPVPTPTTPPAAPTAPQTPTTPVPEAEKATAAPTAEPAPTQAPRPAAPKQAPQPGKKILSEAEIAARLERELLEAVEVQKVVQTTVQASAPKAARFTINDEVLEEILWDLEIGLLESDVALPVIEAIKANVKEQLLSMAVSGDAATIVEKVLRNAIERVLKVNPIDFDAFVRDRMKAKKPVVVMFVGVNGTGKTTSIGRIAYRLKQAGISSVMAAGDTFRAGAIEQLSLHGDRLGITVIKHKAGADPAAVAYDAIEHAKARHKDVVLLDTAGRMQNNSNLMDEMDKIRRVANPDLVVFVGDSLAGNDAVEQARKFDEVVDVGGVILTKVDVDAKGGAALSVAYTINKPLLFVGVGQEYPDLRPFDAKWMVDRLFGDEPAATA